MASLPRRTDASSPSLSKSVLGIHPRTRTFVSKARCIRSVISSRVSWISSIGSSLCNTGRGRLIANGLSVPSRMASTLSSIGSPVSGIGGRMPVSFQISVMRVASSGSPVSAVDAHTHTPSSFSHKDTSVFPISLPCRLQ